MQYRVRTALIAMVSIALVLTLAHGLGPRWQGAAAAGVSSLWMGAAIAVWAIDRFYRRPLGSTLAILVAILLAGLGAATTIVSMALILMFWLGYHVPT